MVKTVGGMTEAEWVARREELDTSFVDQGLHGPARSLHAWLLINPQECKRTDDAFNDLAATGEATLWQQLAAEWAEKLGVMYSDGWQDVVPLISGGAKTELYVRGVLSP